MLSWLNFYQHLPKYINPVAFKVGIFSINWYSLMYLVAFLVVYLLFVYRIKKKEGQYGKNLILDFMFYAVPGVLIGGRLGYVFFYNFPYYLAHPLEALLPIQAASYGLQVIGYRGMSFHGGLIGVILASMLFVRKHKINFFQWADFVAPAVPAGYFFGRLGNFLNGELYGRTTEKFWGMYFLQDPFGLLRHPSQLYEAFFEGLILFIILWTFRNRLRVAGYGLGIYLLGYGFFRFFIEFFREPDEQIGIIFKFFTLGQMLSLAMIMFGVIIFFARTPKNR
jgi:phosphatidylglycerol:prolipoprotein diacylglycerol transferase